MIALAIVAMLLLVACEVRSVDLPVVVAHPPLGRDEVNRWVAAQVQLDEPPALTRAGPIDCEWLLAGVS
jgi:hypothetical protein